MRDERPASGRASGPDDGAPPSPTPGDQRLQAVRDELRALGYLQGRLDRYVLRDLLVRPAMVVPAVRTALRSALVAGPALAVALAFALVDGAPSLAARPGDLLAVLAW